MKKLLLIMIITIVVISCKKEEITDIIPVEQSRNTYISAYDFPLGIDLSKIFCVKDNDVVNTSFNFITDCPLSIKAMNDSIIKIRLPKDFSIAGDSLVAISDTIFEFNTHKFITVGNKTYLNTCSYIIYKPIPTHSYMHSLELEYKNINFPKSRCVFCSINCK